MILHAKVVEHEAALVNAWKNEGGRGLNQENLVATLKSLGYSPDKPKYVQRQAHFNSAEEDSYVPDSVENDIAFGDSLEEGVLKQVYATLKERSRPPPTGGYPFPKEDSVVTKLGKLPPGPCRLCGSEKHWNRECPHYVVYSEGVKRNAKLVSVTEPSEEETMYQSVFSVLLNQTLSRSAGNLDRLGEGSFFDKAVLSIKNSERKTSKARTGGSDYKISEPQTDSPLDPAFQSNDQLGTDNGETATGSDTERRRDSSPERREFFAGMEEVEDKAEAEWRMKDKAEFGLLEEVGEFEDVRSARSGWRREDHMAEEFWLNNGKLPA
jgi:hypothetical protein